MKIVKIEPAHFITIETDGEIYYHFYRSTFGRWYVWTGGGIEPFCEDGEIETLYQQYIYEREETSRGNIFYI